MATLTIASSWTITLSTPELRLVLKALGGRLKEEETQEANELGDKLTELRVRATKYSLHANDKLMKKLEEKQALGDQTAEENLEG